MTGPVRTGVGRPALERRWIPDWPVDLVTTLGVLRHGAGDPTLRLDSSGVWRTTRSENGPATLHYARVGAEVVVRAWGPGAPDELDRVPEVLGAGDDPSGFAADAHPVMARAHRQFGPGWRALRTERVVEALVPAIIEQRVTGIEASRAWAGLVRAHGEAAPGPAGTELGLLVAPNSRAWAGLPSWAWHRAGVDAARSTAITRATRRASALESLSERDPLQARQALATLPGVGAWTAAEVAVRAWGDQDAVSFGDFHVARAVVHTLTGRRDGTDSELADLLRPWEGQRARAVRMLLLHGGHAPPRRAPRAAITDHRHW